MDDPEDKYFRSLRRMFNFTGAAMIVMMTTHFVVELNKDHPNQVKLEHRRLAKERNPYLKEVDRMYR